MKDALPAVHDRLPAGELDEGAMTQLLGYQLAQATVTTNLVFTTVMEAEFELRKVELSVLTLIDANPGVTASQLAVALAVTPPNITMWLDRMDGRGLVERERSAVDRRAQHLRTTALGSNLARQATQRLAEVEQATLAGLSPGERVMLTELLHKVANCRHKLVRPTGTPAPNPTASAVN